MIPVGMILPLLRAKGVAPEEGGDMARDLYASLAPEDRPYVEALVAAFVAGWDEAAHPLYAATLGANV